MRKPVTILTGFLGAGKTTLLNALIASKPRKYFAIIENEFGESGIDADLVQQGNDGIVEMNNGCLCCTLNTELVGIIAALIARKDEFEELIIESTGIADPSGIAAPFLSHPAVKREFSLRNVVCLVDAEQIEDRLEDTEEALKQIAFSNIIVINKTDLIHPDYAKRLKKQLAEINPLATVFDGNVDNFSFLPQLLEGKPFELRDDLPEEKPHDHSHDHHHHAHGDIKSFTLEFDRPFSLMNLQFILTQVIVLRSKGIFRIKGIVYTQDEDYPTLIQAVGNRVVLQPLKSKQGNESKTSRIIFIGKGIKQAPIKSLLDSCLVALSKKAPL